MNKAIIIGNLGADPALRYTDSGAPVCELSVATSESWVKDGEKKEKTEWHRVVVFSKQAEACGKYLAKGKKVAVEGRIQTRKWQDKQGQDRYTTEIVADHVEFLSSAGGEKRNPDPAPDNGDLFGDDEPAF